MRKIQATFYPKLSSFLLMYLMLAHIFGAICFYISMNGQWIYLIFFILLGISILYFCQATGVLSKRSVYSLEFISDRQWRLLMTNGEMRDVVLSGKSIVTKYFIILHFSDLYTPYKKALLLFPDSLSRQKLRLLRRCVTLGFL